MQNLPKWAKTLIALTGLVVSVLPVALKALAPNVDLEPQTLDAIKDLPTNLTSIIGTGVAVWASWHRPTKLDEQSK